MPTPDSHDSDFYGWTQTMARALRTGTATPTQLLQIADEVEDMGKSERRALASRLQVLMVHLLKWRHQPRRRSRSWRRTIALQRLELERLLRDNPSLRREVAALVSDGYPAARLAALAETDLPDERFPAACPFAVDDVLAGSGDELTGN